MRYEWKVIHAPGGADELAKKMSSEVRPNQSVVYLEYGSTDYATMMLEEAAQPRPANHTCSHCGHTDRNI